MPASKILEAIDQLAKATDHEDWRHPALREFLMHGDEAVLVEVPEFRNQWIWVQQTAALLPSPDQWTEEAARIFRIAKLKGESIVKRWIELRQADDTLSGAGLEPALACVRAAGFTPAEIRLMASLLKTWDGQKPTPLGLLLLEGSDDEPLEWLAYPNAPLDHIKCRSSLLCILATTQPERLHRLLAKLNRDELNDPEGERDYETIIRANPGEFAHSAYRHAKNLSLDSPRRIRLMMAISEVSPLSYLDRVLEEASSVVETAGERGHPASVFGEGGLIATRFLVRQKHPRAMELCCLWINSLAKDKGGFCVAGREELWEEIRMLHPHWQPALIKAAVTSKLAKLVAVGLGWWLECWQAEDTAQRAEALRALEEGKLDDKLADGTGELKVVALARITALIWPLMQHKSKEMRKAAARALADLGETFVSQKGQELLQHKKAEVREAVAELFSILSAPPSAGAEAVASPGAARRAKLLQGRAIANPQSLAYPFLEDMYADEYIPARLVDKVTKILLHLCEQIELQKPAGLDALYKLTHAATEKINLLQDQFEDAGSEIETEAREIMSDNFCFIASAYGFEDADREELIATRDW